MRVALATCAVKPEPDPDELPLLEELRGRGVDAQALAWDDPTVDWAGSDLVVLRSTWNYAEQPSRFLEWIDAVASASEVLNPPDIARANLDKRYLLHLAARGVPTVPTLFFDTRTPSLDLGKALKDEGWHDVVIKPVVGAASFRTRRFSDGRGDAAQRYLAEQLDERAMMVQPYQQAVEGVGERALVWIDGALSHAIRKTPRFDGEDESVSEALAIEPAERELADAALAPYAARLLYARVDVVNDDSGQPRIMELELVEPSLFLVQRPSTLERFADAIAARASG